MSKNHSNQINTLASKAAKAIQIGNLAEAKDCYIKLSRLLPDHPEIYGTLGGLSIQLGKFNDAIQFLNNSLSILPNQPTVLFNQAIAYKQLNFFEKALICYDRAIQLKPDYFEAYFNQANLLKDLKFFDKAIVSYQRAAQFQPNFIGIYLNWGGVLVELKRYDEALISYDRAIQLKPDDHMPHNGKGNTLHELKRYDEALISYDRAIQLKPHDHIPYNSKGNALQELKRYDEALISYDRAIQLKPDDHMPHNGKGNTLRELKRYDEALISYDRAIQLKPDDHMPHNGKGNTLRELKRYDEALASDDRAIQLKPDSNNYVYGSYIHTKSFMCHWSNINQELNTLLNKIESHEKASTPFPLLSLVDNLEVHKKVAQIYAEDQCPLNPILGKIKPYSKHQKIRLGYFSPDFREHAVSYLTAELFEIHDQSKFELYAFSFSANNKDDAMQQRIQRAFNYFIDVSKMSDQEIVLLARQHEIDIAIDLAGHTQGSRTNIFAYRAASIQISYIGYLGTMGAPYIDYLIADETIIPEELKQFYSEKILYLPTYQCNDTKKQISTKSFTKEELELPQEGFIFCSFNNSYKFNASIFDSWMRILNAVKGSFLWLLADNPFVETNLKKEAMTRGVDPQRLIFAKKVPRDEYLARFKVADLFLDTHPYNAGTTASDALWEGLPLVTFLGKSFASRMCGSILKSAHLSELVAESQKEYEKLAIQLASNHKKLDLIKQKMRNIKEMPLFDIRTFTKNIEAEYLKIYQQNKNE
jgi:predicted O-linked N-acetylglucosamine transferase (SPINDLY family)